MISSVNFGENQLKQFVERYSNFAPQYVNVTQMSISGEGVLKRYDNESVYYGQLSKENRHGSGFHYLQKYKRILVQKDGTIYAGQWENDLRHGKGFMRYATDSTYEGTFQNDLQEGYGVYIWNKTGASYKGQWQSNKRHGQGTWAQGNASYTGTWRVNKPEGKGIQISQTGDRYEGDFLSSQKHGLGQEQYRNGDIYIGQYMNGKPQGKGKYLWNNKSFYEGDRSPNNFLGGFFNGLRHGSGYQKNADGSSYSGQYINDMKCGEGIQVWSSGNFYKGQFFNDKRQSYGEMYWVDGSYYKGMWDDGSQNGEGELVNYTVGQGIKKGTFKNNMLVNLYIPEQERFLREGISTPPNLSYMAAQKLLSKPSPEPQKTEIMFPKEKKRDKNKMPKIKISYKSQLRQENSSFQNEIQQQNLLLLSRQQNSGTREDGRVDDITERRGLVNSFAVNDMRSQSVNNNEYSRYKEQSSRSYERSYPRTIYDYSLMESPRNNTLEVKQLESKWRPPGRYRQKLNYF